MKDLLLRASAHARDLARLLAAIDRTAVSNGRLIVTPQMITDSLVLVTNDALRFENVTLTADGAICLNVFYGGMALAYTLKIVRFSVANGVADGCISYTEERRGGGIGRAVLGLTGKSGLAVALSGRRWLRVTDHEIQISSRTLLPSLHLTFQSASSSGLMFRVS